MWVDSLHPFGNSQLPVTSASPNIATFLDSTDTRDVGGRYIHMQRKHTNINNKEKKEYL